MNQEQLEDAYVDHESRTDETGFHVDGCFYCGGNHPSDCCPDSSAKDEYWDNE